MLKILFLSKVIHVYRKKNARYKKHITTTNYRGSKTQSMWGYITYNGVADLIPIEREI